MDLYQMILRALQLLWVLLITALIGNVIASNQDGPMASINFTMFVAVVSWLAVLYGLAASLIERLAIPLVVMGLDFLAVLFSFISAVVLSAELTVTNCAGDYTSKNSGWVAFGSSNTEKRCREIQASTAFMWFLWASFAATLIFAYLSFRRTGGSVRSGHPHMSQVRGV